MTLKAAIQGGVAAAFQAIGDLAPELQAYERTRGADYDPDTSTVYTGSFVDVSGIKGVPYDFETQDIDGENVRNGDQKFILERQALSFTPCEYDVLVFTDGTRWSIRGIETDPADGTYIFHLRRDKGKQTEYV